MGWPAPLDKVFVPRKGNQIKTLAGAYAYLLKLPKCRHKEKEVQAAGETAYGD